MVDYFSIEILKNYLKTPILKINKPIHHNNAMITDIITTFGTMTLIIQTHQHHQLYQIRNQSLKSHSFHNLFPLIYQQIVLKQPNSLNLICISLVEQIQILNYQMGKTDHELSKILQCAMKVYYNTQLQLSEDNYLMKNLMKSKNNSPHFYMNFTSLKMRQIRQERQVSLFLNNLQRMYQEIPEKDSLLEIILIKEKTYRLNRKVLKNVTTWFQLANYFNFIPHLIVKSYNSVSGLFKEMPISKINGNHQIQYKQTTYNKLVFIQGKCSNMLIQIPIQELRARFFQDHTLYTLQKRINYAIARKCGPNILDYSEFVGKSWKNIPQQQDFSDLMAWLPNIPVNTPSDTIVVKPNINKVQSINFLITYFNYIKPVVNEIKFHKDSNSLRLHLTTQKYPNLIIDIIFHSKYVIKDSQISMIIEKALIKKCKINLNQMEITDSLILFLANSQKMGKVVEFQIAKCSKVTENGLGSLLISPYCKNLEVLNLSDLVLSQTSIDTIIHKLNKVTKLTINRCLDNIEPLKLNTISLQYLQAFGTNIDINFAQNLKVLRLDCQLSWECLRNLRGLSLTQLKICLVESKKNIMNVFNNFYLKDSNPGRAFAEGKSQKTLKKIDLSHSSIKFKLIKPIFNMQALQTLILNNCDKIGNDFDALSPQIVNISLRGTHITIAQLNILLAKTIHLISLNIAYTPILKSEILHFLMFEKKSLNIIEISEDQYTNKYLEKQRIQVNCIKVYIEKLINPQNQTVFNYMLNKLTQSVKTIYFQCDQKYQKLLIQKSRKLLTNISVSPPKNLFINNIGYYQIFHRQLNKSKDSQFIKAQGNSVEIWQQNEPIHSITYHFTKAMRQYSDNLLVVSLKGNKVVGGQVIRMMRDYGSKRVKSIDFRNCLFTFTDVVQFIFDFTFLQQVNNSHYEMQMNEQNFTQMSQKYLKFFMKIQKIKSLTIQLYNIKEVQILYSVLYHILNHHSDNIRQLGLSVVKISNHKESDNFWRLIFDLNKLHTLSIRIQESEVDKKMQQAFEKMALMKLKKLSLNIPSTLLPCLQNKELSELDIDLTNQPIPDAVLGKSIKNLTILQQLNLKCDGCMQIVNLNKIGNISKFVFLQSVSLSFQYCPLKQSTLYELIDNIKELKGLRKFQLNISYTIQTWNDLLKSVEELKEELKNTFIRIIAINRTSSQFVFNREQLTLMGIDFII